MIEEVGGNIGNKEKKRQEGGDKGDMVLNSMRNGEVTEHDKDLVKKQSFTFKDKLLGTSNLEKEAKSKVD